MLAAEVLLYNKSCTVQIPGASRERNPIKIRLTSGLLYILPNVLRTVNIRKEAIPQLDIEETSIPL